MLLEQRKDIIRKHFWKNVNIKKTRTEVENLINNDLDSSSYDESDSEFDNVSDNGSNNDESND